MSRILQETTDMTQLDGIPKAASRSKEPGNLVSS